VTTSPDVTVSTNLGPWVNRRGIFDRAERADTFREEHVVSAQRWAMSPQGQHIELGIAESNLFLQLAALGLAGPLFGTRLFPIGTLYDPFIKRGLDALNYACYQDARFILVATPSGITLAPEGGAHQSVGEPLIGLAQPGLMSFEPAYADELAVLLRWAFEEIQRDAGESVYFRLSTRPVDQPQRTIDPDLAEAIVAGAYWLYEPELAIAYCGAVAPEALAAYQAVAEDIPGAGLLAITSPDRLHRDWRAARARGESGVAKRLLARLRPGAALVTVGDFHPATLSWLGAVAGNTIVPLGIDRFGQSVNPGTSPISTAPTASTPMRSSTPPPAPASRYCGNRNERRPPAMLDARDPAPRLAGGTRQKQKRCGRVGCWRRKYEFRRTGNPPYIAHRRLPTRVRSRAQHTPGIRRLFYCQRNRTRPSPQMR
jgi:pyruvate dehydrogenase E1 component